MSVKRELTVQITSLVGAYGSSRATTKWTLILISFVVFFSRGTVDDTELVEGLVLEQKISHLAGGISQVEKAKIGLIQFCISPPKTDVSPCFCKNLLTSVLLFNLTSVVQEVDIPIYKINLQPLDNRICWFP